MPGKRNLGRGISEGKCLQGRHKTQGNEVDLSNYQHTERMKPMEGRNELRENRRSVRTEEI